MYFAYKFTGKERDAESGLDYFGARYYASGMGRWMSPDWAKTPEGVPYADLSNPQSLNLYGYVGNNPLSRKDDDGHETETYDDGKLNRTTAQNAPMSPREAQFHEGVLGAAGVVLAAPEIGAAAVVAIGHESLSGVAAVGVATLGAVGTAVNSAAQIMGAATNTNTQNATDHVTTVTNLIAAGVGLVSGSAHTGAQAADIATVAGATKSPAAAVGAAASLGSAIDAAKNVASSVSNAMSTVTNAVKSFFTPPLPPPPAPRPPQ